MKVFLAGTSIKEEILKEHKVNFILESFYLIKEWQIPYVKKCKMFLLDSGAFTFMNNLKNKTKINFNNYLTEYINFINKYDIKYFFELDIDIIVGYEEVKKLRTRLEKETNKKCIPVWHKSRGLKEWVKLTKEYDYIAIGGIVTKEIKPTEYKFFTPMLKIAKENNCKVHGLGFTNLKTLNKYHFYSVDSTSWLSGGRFGQLYIFKNNTLKQISYNNKRIKDYMVSHHFNIEEWIKFQKYADKYL